MKFALSVLAVVVAALTISSVSGAQEYYHRDLTSTDLARIQINYQLDYRSVSAFGNSTDAVQIWNAKPLELSVSRAGLQPNDHVRAVVINKIAQEAACGRPASMAQSTSIVDMRWSHGFFVGDFSQFAPTVRALGTCVKRTGWIEVAIVVNGVWLKDPINQTSNFEVRFTR
jgi:hypothetical protein